MKKLVFKITNNRLHNVQVKVKRWITRGRNKESENEVLKEKNNNKFNIMFERRLQRATGTKKV